MIYKIIEEAKEGKLFTDDEMEKMFSFNNGVVLLNIINSKAKEEDNKVSKLAEIISKARDDYYKAVEDENLKDFQKELEMEISKKIKDRHQVKKDLFDEMNKVAANNSFAKSQEEEADDIVFRLFLNSYNNKYSFTWKMFKQEKKDYEKNHILDGENIYTLKSLLEKDPKIKKVENYTVFCKAAGTLSKEIIDKIKEKIMD